MARMPNRSDLESAVDAAINLGKAQAKALAALPGAINAVAEAANNINATANEARAVIRKAQAVTDRLDSMLDHVEPAVSEITPTLQALKEAQQRIVAMTGSTEKLASFVDDAGAGLSRLAGLSGAAGLFNRLAGTTKPEPAGRLTAVRSDPTAELLPPETPTEEVLAELLGADAEPIDLDDPEIHDADLVGGVIEDAPAEDSELLDEELADAELVEVEREGPELVEQPPVPSYDYFGQGQGNGQGNSPELEDKGNSSPEGNDNSQGNNNSSQEGNDQNGSNEGNDQDHDPLLDEAVRHPVELGSEADGPDVTESATG